MMSWPWDGLQVTAEIANDADVAGRFGSQFFDRYERGGELADLVKAIALFRAAVSATSVADSDHALYLSNEAAALVRLAERTGEMKVLAEAVRVGRAAATATSAGDSYRPQRLVNLIAALIGYGGRTGESGAFSEAAELSRELMASISEGDPDSVTYLSNSALALMDAGTQTEDRGLLEEAARLARRAASAASIDSPERAGALINLSSVLRRVYEVTQQVSLLHEAAESARKAVAVAHERLRGMALDRLAVVLETLSEASGDGTVLAEAARAGRDAVAITPADDPRRAGYLNNCGNALRALADLQGDTVLLAEAVHMYREAVACTPPDNPNRAGRMSNLTTVSSLLAQRTGDISAGREAVQAGQEAVAAAASGHRERGKYLDHLRSSMQRLHLQTDDAALLPEIVDLARESVQATPAGHRELAIRLRGLHDALYNLYANTEDPAVLEEAVQVVRHAIVALSDDDPNRSLYLHDLGKDLLTVSELTGNTSALAEGLQAIRGAVTAASATDAAADHRLLLSRGLLLLFDRTHDTDHLKEATQLARDAAEAIETADGLYAVAQAHLGYCLSRLSKYMPGEDTLAEARKCFRLAVQADAGPAQVRIEACLALQSAGGSPQDTLAAMETAIGLLSQIGSDALDRADRMRYITQVSYLPALAAAAALSAGQPGRALELLEQGRGILVSEILDVRSSQPALLRESQQPDLRELASELDELRGRMALLSHPELERTDRSVPTSEITQLRLDARAAWNDLIARIREHDGFETFLQPADIHELTLQAREGPIIFVNASPSRCDALILTSDPVDPVHVIPLTGLAQRDAADRAIRLRTALERAWDSGAGLAERLSAQQEILDVLRWIWDTVTSPILAFLGYEMTPPADTAWPRVWWCPVGILALLPLHASGDHLATPTDGQARPTVMDRVVSSYVTTLRGLTYARGQQPGPVDTTLIVAVPDAPQTPRLPGVIAESRALAQLIPGAHIAPHPTRATVLPALPTNRVAHFACHGYANMTTPAASHLALYDHLNHPLTVADVSALHLPGGLAYLAACDTAVSRPDLADQAIHITGAFHLAGYQQVIGTLWPVNDALARTIATAFYDVLTASGTEPPEIGHGARALHHAIRKARDDYTRTPSNWAGYAHIGA